LTFGSNAQNKKGGEDPQEKKIGVFAVYALDRNLLQMPF